MTEQQIREKRRELLAQRYSLLDEIGDGEPTQNQLARLQRLKNQDARLEADMQNAALSRPAGREIPAFQARNQRRYHATARDHAEEALGGFGNLQEMLGTVMGSTMSRQMDNRLHALMMNAAGSDEQSGASDPYGGFLIPQGFAETLMGRMVDIVPVFERVTKVTMQTRQIVIPARVDANHSSSVSGGLRVYRKPETQAVSSSRMELEQVILAAKTLLGLTYSSEELLEDSPQSVFEILSNSFASEFSAELLTELINGTGAGEMEGLLNSPATISITRNTGGDIKGADIIAMRERCWRYSEAVWLANHDTLSSLEIAHRSGTNADSFYFRAGSVIPGIGQNASVDIPDTLLGRPIFFTEHAPALGSAGDLILFVPSEYLIGHLGPGPTDAPRSAESIHVRFEEHERTFKFWMRNDGRTWWRSALTPRNGANTLSCSVIIAA